MEKFVIMKDILSKVKRFNVYGRKMEFKLKPVPKTKEPTNWIKSGIEDILTQGLDGLQPTDKVGITFCGKDFERGPGWINFQNAADLKINDIWEMISKIYQSNSVGFNTETFCLGVTSVRLPTGQGRGKNYNTFDEECGMRKGIIAIKNKDNLCLPRALVVAMAYANRDPEKNKIRRDIGKLQTSRAQDLMQEAAVVVPQEGCGVPELQQFQDHLTNYQIIVYNYGSKGHDVIFKGNDSEKRLNLLYHKGHYNVITSLTAAFCCAYFCEDCNKPYEHKKEHRCVKTCPCCQQTPSCPWTEDILCSSCNRKFRGALCLEKHTKEGICEKINRCRDCLKTVNSNRQHICGEMFCKNCKKHQPSPHYCYIQPDQRSPSVKDLLFIFYDLETRQEEELMNGKLHTPNLCVFQQRCSVCIDLPTTKIVCPQCGVRTQTVKYHDPIAPFMQYILQLRKKFKQVVVLAHYGGGFDHQFILRYILEVTDLKPELIMRGTKIVMMSVKNVKFLDSLNYFPMPLAALPKAFGFNELKKGYFPHLFNTLENRQYSGPLPAIEFYDPDNLKPEDRKKFLDWHNQHKNDTFNFQQELVDYCISDVQILTEACLKFRKIMLDECNVCPFTEACTIASTCNLVFRRNFLQPETIGIIPKNGYRMCDNQSPLALQWLIFEADQRGIVIQHTGNGREVVLQGVKVDGYCSATNQVFEFHGCYYHGHTCLSHKRDQPLYDDPHDTLEKRYETTRAKTERLKSFGYDVIEKWQCDFKITPEMEYLNSHPLLCMLPLNPRDAFYGGRTGNVKTYHKCQPGEKIKYLDVCSLYPYVCKTGVFPVKHPTVYVGDDCSTLELSKSSGLVKCTILPPKDLFHPVLPQKMNKKLMFVLCRTCGESLNSSPCRHMEQERALTGTWVIEEVNKALAVGYKMIKIYEIWAYNTVQQNQHIKGLFTSMMNTFLKIKQEASGWPSHCNTEEQKQKYIKDFLNREDIQLEYSLITKNSGLRTLAKLLLNSFWGKFGQRENQTKTSIINDPSDFFSMLSNPAVAVQHILPINETTLVVNWCYKEEAADSLSTVNVAIAAYVTTQARLKLYSYLQALQDRVLYYDTDSCLFISKEGEWEPPTGEFIGDMTDELECYGPGSYITEFVCGGPKNYSFQVYSPTTNTTNTVCKVKGIKLTHKNSEIINFESIRDMVLSGNDGDMTPLLVSNKNFQRTENHGVVTCNVQKLYHPTSNKRRFCEDHTSTPYGFKKHRVVDSLL